MRHYNIKSAIFNWGDAWKEVKMSIVANCWEKILIDVKQMYAIEEFEPADFHKTFSLAGDKGISINDVETWLKADDKRSWL
jgi:hypothetical protein